MEHCTVEKALHLRNSPRMTKKKMRIAILGTRGVPARYGGFETFAEELGKRLVERGHQVLVYGRRGKTGEGAEDRFVYRGIEGIRTGAVYHKYLETLTHTFTSLIHVRRENVDGILLCNAANSPLGWMATLSGIPLVINVDGIERRRSKWNMVGKAWYRLGELCSVLFGRTVIADAPSIAQYYRRTYCISPEIITYGAKAEPLPPGETLHQFGLLPKKYLLYVSRLEPENNALGVVLAYRKVETDMPLVIVGDAPYADEYQRQLREVADERVIFTGYQFGERYRELRSNCFLAVQATEVGGAHPALIEAMAYENCIVANAVPEHFEVLGGAGRYYHRNNFDHLAEVFQELVSDPIQVEQFGREAKLRAEQRFTWDSICDAYEEVFRKSFRKGGVFTECRFLEEGRTKSS